VEFDKTEECQNAYKTLGKSAREENTGWEYSLLAMVFINICIIL